MRVVRLQGCLPALLVLLALAGFLALAFAAGTAFFVAGVALALLGAALRGLGWLARLGRPEAPRPPPGPARDQVIEVAPEERGVERDRLPPGGGGP